MTMNTKLNIDDTLYETRLTSKYENRRLYYPHNPHHIKAVIAGVVREIPVKIGQKIQPHTTLLILEAMKMLNPIQSEVGGTVKAIHVKTDQQVPRNQLLIELE